MNRAKLIKQKMIAITLDQSNAVLINVSNQARVVISSKMYWWSGGILIKNSKNTRPP